MKHPIIYEALNGSKPDSEKSRLLNDYLRTQVANYRENPEQGIDIAYAIAGLLATDYVRSLPEDSPALTALSIASQLELPEQHRQTGSTWSALIDTISELNTP